MNIFGGKRNTSKSQELLKFRRWEDFAILAEEWLAQKINASSSNSV